MEKYNLFANKYEAFLTVKQIIMFAIQVKEKEFKDQLECNTNILHILNLSAIVKVTVNFVCLGYSVSIHIC